MTSLQIKPQEDPLLELIKFTKFNQSISTQKTHFYSLWDFCCFLGDKWEISLDSNKKREEISKLMNEFCKLSSLKAKLLVTNYLNNLLAKGQATSTLATKLSAIKNHISYCREFTDPPIPSWDLNGFKPPKVEKRKISGPSEVEFEKILSYLIELEKSNSYIKERNALLCYILAFGALRISEALSINIEDIDFDKRKINISRKGRRLRQDFYLGKLIMEKIYLFVKKYKRFKGPLFINKDHSDKSKTKRLGRTSAWRIVKQIGKNVGIEDLHPHKFRHFAATEALVVTDFNAHQATKFTSHLSKKQIESYEDERDNVQERIASQIEKRWLDRPAPESADRAEPSL